jgi:dimethylglycine dehydrogenase
MTAGADHGLTLFGAYAMNAMRLEKGYRAIGADLTSERTPIESGIRNLVQSRGRSFIGKKAMLARDHTDGTWRSVLLALDPHGPIEPFYAHTVFQDEQPVGILTSAAYGHRVGQHLALALLKPKTLGKEFEVLVLNQKVKARVLDRPPYDPDNLRMKAG